MADFSYQAKQSAEELKRQLQDQMYGTLQTTSDTQKQIAQNQTNALLQSLANQEQRYQTDYQENARQNYINQVLGKQTVTDQLKRMGLYNSGYGVSQLSDVDATAAQNLTALKNALQENITGLNEQRNTAQSNLENTLLGIEGDYAKNRLALDQYINQQYQNQYENTYNRLFAEYQEQQAAARAAAQLAYQRQRDALADARYQREYNDQLAQMEGYISAGDKADKTQAYDVLNKAIKNLKNGAYYDTTSQDNTYALWLNNINNANISSTQAEKLKSALDAAANTWKINKKTSSNKTTSTTSGSSKPSTNVNASRGILKFG